MKIHFILNPRSGARRRADLAADLRRFIADHRCDGQVATTEHPGHATELAARGVADGCEVVVAVGGDGTMNEVASALVDTEATLGLVPCGSGNGLARHLRIPLRIPGALEVLVSGRPRLIDTGIVNGRPFFNAVGIGYEAEIAAAFAAQTRRGLAGYFSVGLPLLFPQPEEACRVMHDGGIAILKVFTLAVLNSDQYGNNAVMAPGASVDDGRFDLVSVRRIGLLRAAGFLWHLRRGTIGQMPELTRLISTRYLIERPAAGPWHVDGEPCPPADRLEITIRPRSLRVMVPSPA